MLLLSLNCFGKSKFVKFVKILSLNIKLINPMQKYPHIPESYTCILWIFAMIFLLPMDFLVSFGICSTPKQL